MSEGWNRRADEALVVDGVSVRFLPETEDTWSVVGDDGEMLGRLVLTQDRSRFVAYRADGDAVTKASRWGGRVTARFGTRELATRALLTPRED